MDRIISQFNLAVERIRGGDEYEIYNNYVEDLPRFEPFCQTVDAMLSATSWERVKAFSLTEVQKTIKQWISFFIEKCNVNERIDSCLSTFFEEERLQTKDDSKAAQMREQGNDAFKSEDCKQSLALYTKSLCYATVEGPEYASALANRSEVYFFVNDYKSCIEDINLCLQASYPDCQQPTLYIRKAKCFQKMGDTIEMRKTLIDALNFIDGISSEFSELCEDYKEIIKNLITETACPNYVAEENFEVLPVLETNAMFLNASDSIRLKYSKQRGCYVVANKEIAVGEVLFVEKAYAFDPNDIPSIVDVDKHCQYCLLKLTSCVPCKTCVEHLYCNENCRDLAWTEFHQWECLAVQANFSTCCANLAFRVILKTFQNGFPTETINFQDGVNKYGDKDNNYPYVYNLPANIHQINKKQLLFYVAAAALLVKYLKLKTNFFQMMKELPNYSKNSVEQLMATVGGLIVRHCGQTHCHIVPVWDYDNEYFMPNEITIADAICPSMTMMSHSCFPNTGHYFVGDTVVVKAIKNIQIDEDISYLYAGVPFSSFKKSERENILPRRNFFKCNCLLCTDPKAEAYNSYLCPKCKGSTTPPNVPPILPISIYSLQEYVCLDCNYIFVLPTYVVLKENFAYGLLVKSNQLYDADDVNRCIELYKTIFRPYHFVFELLYTARKDHCKINGDVKGFIENGMLLLECLEEKRNGPAVKVGRDSYAYCVTAVNMLQNIASMMDLRQFGEVLIMLSVLAEKAKFVFNLHHAPFITRIKRVEKVICELQDLYASRMANENM